MNEKRTCPGCPECKPAGSTQSVSGSGTGDSLSREKFAALMDAAYERYRRLPHPDAELFDAASYVAGLEHGYCERQESADKPATLFSLLFTGALAIGVLIGLALR